MKKFLIVIFIFGLIGTATFFLIKKNVESPILRYSISAISDTYQEYMFDSGNDNDLGFTRRALVEIRKSEMMIDQNTSITKDGESMKYAPNTAEDNKKGVIEKRIYNNDIYELHKPAVANTQNYRMFKNDEMIFEKSMEYGADGPVLDWRIVNGKPAFTFRTNLCSQSECVTDIFYDGKFFSEEYGVKNPRHLFSSQGKFGFVVSDIDGDKIFFDGDFVTPMFDAIYTHNCCSLMEILPTTYENGVLLFYGKRNNKNYIAEVKLNKK